MQDGVVMHEGVARTALAREPDIGSEAGTGGRRRCRAKHARDERLHVCLGRDFGRRHIGDFECIEGVALDELAEDRAEGRLGRE